MLFERHLKRLGLLLLSAWILTGPAAIVQAAPPDAPQDNKTGEAKGEGGKKKRTKAKRAPRKLLGIPMLERATLVEGESYRVRSPASYDQTVKYYRKHFRRHGVAVTWKKIVNLPGIKAVHVACRDKDAEWEGMNIYWQHGETRLFLFPKGGPNGNDAKGKKPGGDSKKT